ncbi:hypothetical protein JOF28_001036 [Leucobacter exalbidus]|uniref:DUF3375 domain-containing protein n=1 Tax=Leucobacter exalbidus TaxID=662960 RepID=A0A940PQM5_9MICO|nr:DUF3375 domain-containing protein [Leucobacter exalbidus]MBP1325804.1 hypothetical protein [Leucobacter exalbidus]
MSVLPTALAIQRLSGANATIDMLRANTLPVMAAVLGEYFGSPSTRVPTDELHELIDADLQTLREHFDLGTQSAKGFCDGWREKKVIIRRAAEGSRGETYELSAAGFDAIRIIDQLITPQSTLTESRLMTLAQSLQSLAIDTDPDTSRKLRALEQQRERLDEEITRLRSGEVEPLDPRVATERITDILLQAQGLPADFARVRARFEDLNQELRVAILSLDDHQSNVIMEIFRGVDLISESDEGRTFQAFSGLIRDPESSAAFESNVREILNRDFASQLPANARRQIRNLLRDMKMGSRDVQGTLTEFARGLRRYVRSQDYQRDRALRTLIQEALSTAAPARMAIKPFTEIGMSIDLPVISMSSIGGVSPHDPSAFDAGELLGDAESGEVDLAQLVLIARESEIDFAELSSNVNSYLEVAGTGSVADVLREFPSSQGLASVVGLLALATRHGLVDTDNAEQLTWTGLDDVTRTATVTRHVFTERIDL